MLKQLFDAIRRNDVAQVDKLVDAEPGLLAQRDDAGMSAISLSAYMENAPLTTHLRSKRGKPDFFEAIIVGDLAAVRDELARGRDVNEFAPDGFPPLGLAVFFRQPEIARLLLDAGAVVNAQSKNALRVSAMSAAVARGDIAMVEQLLYRGADPNIMQQRMFRPIHEAAMAGSGAAVALLLMFGADPAALSEEGKRAADYARSKGHTALARQLDVLAK